MEKRNKMIIENEYICIKTLIIMADSEYGYNVYAKHGYKDISVNFNTDSEDFIRILKEINNIFKKIDSLKEEREK